MTPPSAFLAAAQTAIRAATSVGATKSVTLRRTVSTYNPATGANSDVVTDYTGWNVVVSRFDDAMTDGSHVLVGDRLLIGAALDLSVTPDPETDTIILDSLQYDIIRRLPDPADATHQLQVRR